MKENLTPFQHQIKRLLHKVFPFLMLLVFAKTYAQPSCSPIATNFSENFDSTSTGSSTTPSVPTCWSYIDNMTTTGYGYTATSATTVTSAPNFFRFYRMSSTANVNEDLTLVSPETVNLGNGTKQVRFYATGNSATVNSVLEVVRLDGNTATATATVLATINITGTAYTEYIVPLPVTTDDYFGFRIAHNGSTTTTYPYAFIDDVFYEDLETCFFPTNTTVSNITQTAATIAWTASIDANVTGYEYEVRSSGTPGSGATGLAAFGTTTAITANVTGLSPSANYTVYVKSVCGTSSGRWNPIYVNFYTLCGVVSGNLYEGFDTTTIGTTTNNNFPNCWSYLDDVTTTGYGYVNASNAQSPGNSYRLYRTNSVANQAQNIVLISPETNNLGNGTKQLRFSVRAATATNLNNLEIVSASGNDATATFTVLRTINVDYTTYQEYIIPLPATTDDYFGFRLSHNGTTTLSTVHLDDIYYEDLADCFFPTLLTTANITQNTVDLSWTASVSASVTAYEYEVRSSGTPGSGAVGLEANGTVTGTSTTVTGLSASGTYTVYMRSVCGSTEGIWNPVSVTFSTLCGIVSSNLYENFDSTTSGTSTNPSPPNCWTYLDDMSGTGYGYTYNSATYAQSGSNSFRFYMYNALTNDNQYLYLISPETNNLGNGTKQIRFSARMSSATTPGRLEVVRLSDLSSPTAATASATVLATMDLNNVTYQEYIVPLATTTDDYFAFRVTYNGNPANNYPTTYIDDIYYEDLSPCIFPMNLDATNITENTATVSWNASLAAGVTGYEYEIRTSGAPGSGATGLETSGTVPVTSINITGLDPATQYFVYIRSVCGASNGLWTTFPVNFYTLCGTVTGNLYEHFDSTDSGTTSNPSPPICWTYLDDMTGTGYGYTYNSATYAQSGSNSFRFYMYNAIANNDQYLYLISPETNNLGNGTKQVRFSARTSSASASGRLEIVHLNDLSSPTAASASATVIATVDLNNTSYDEFIVPLPATTDDYFAFRVTYNGNPSNNYPTTFIDDVYYEDLSPCIFPMNVDVTNITENTATVSWDTSLATGVTGYEYEIRTTGAAGSGTTGLVQTGTVTAPTTSINITGLIHSTNYTVYIRSVCGTSNGLWSPFIVKFNTLCGIIMGNLFEGFENAEIGAYNNNTVPNCWTYIKTGPTANYPNGYVATTQPNTGSNHFYSYRSSSHDGESLLISPETDNLGNGTKRLRFSARLYYSGPTYGEKLSIYSMDGNTATANKTLLKTINITSTAYTEYIVYLPISTTDDYFAFSFDEESMTKYIFIDDVYYEDAPDCRPIDESTVKVTNISKNNFIVTWQDLYNLNPMAYEVEVRETGDPGTPGASFIGTTAVGVTTITATGLNPSTEYKVYIRSVCSATDQSTWTSDSLVTTLCNYSDFVSYTTSLALCGPQKAELDAVLVDSTATAAWYDNENDAIPLFEGSNFVSTTDVTQDRSFWLRSRKTTADSSIQIGEGTLTTMGNQTFLYHLWGGYKHQYIFTAAELGATGLVAGPITALKFDVAAVGTPTRNDFSISLGTTAQAAASTTHIDNNNLTLVYSNTAETFALGIKTFTFTTPYVWDGVSNIVVQTVWSNQNTGGGSTGGSGALKYHTTTPNMNTYTWADNKTAAEFLTTLTGNVNGSGGTGTNNGRPNTVFVGIAGCISPAIEIPVTVSDKPAFELSTDKTASCEGTFSDPVTITTNLGGYDTFVWSPSTGVSGDAVNGWTFSSTQEQEYTLLASQSNGICEQIKTVLVYSGIKPKPNPNLATVLDVCKDAVTELNVLESLPSTITLGNGTTTTAPTSEVSAFVQSAEFSKQQYIYSAAELLSQGLTTAGYITDLAFETVNSGSSMTNGNYTVKMMLSANTSFPDNNFTTGSFNTVYSASTHTHTFQGTQNFTLDQPFYWDGQSNIIVQITQEGTGGGNNAETYFTSIAGTNVGLYASSTTDADPVSGTRTTDRLNAKFGLEQSTVTWSPASNLYLDAAATIPYTAGLNALKVYSTSSSPGTKVHTALLTAPSGCSTAVDYTINVADVGIPVVQAQTFCEATPVTAIVVTGNQGVVFNFYDSATAITAITTISQTGTYYVEAVLNDCKSARIPFTATITPLGLPTASFTQVLCGSGTVADLIASGTSGTQINWYDSATATTPLASTQALVDNTTYYAAQTLGNCESGRISVLVSINTTALPSLTPQTITVCGDLTYGSIDLNQVVGSELVWYPSATSQTPIPNTNAIVSGTYYVSQKINNCESSRVQITVSSAQSNVPAPTAGIQNICGGGTVAQLTANILPNATAIWYSDATSTTPLASTATLVNGTYYLAQQEENCLSPRIPVAVRVISTEAPAVTSFVLCEGSTVASLDIPATTGTSYQCFLNSTSVTPLPLTDILNSGYYFVTRVENGCESLRTQVQVTINSRPESPVGTTPQTFTDYAEISNLIMNEPNVVWYTTYDDAMKGINPLNQDMPLINGTTYYAVIIGVNGCPSLPTPIEAIIVLGVNDFDLANLKHYPNPVNDLLTITYTDVITNVEVFDLNGRLVIKRNFDTESVQLDFSTLSSGTYMLNIKTKENSQFVKIVKK